MSGVAGYVMVLALAAVGVGAVSGCGPSGCEVGDRTYAHGEVWTCPGWGGCNDCGCHDGEIVAALGCTGGGMAGAGGAEEP